MRKSCKDQALLENRHGGTFRDWEFKLSSDKHLTNAGALLSASTAPESTMLGGDKIFFSDFSYFPLPDDLGVFDRGSFMT